MLLVSRKNVVRIVIALSLLAITLTPFVTLGVNIAFACTGAGNQCGGG